MRTTTGRRMIYLRNKWAFWLTAYAFFEKGILPGAGGLFNQDWLHIERILLIQEAFLRYKNG